MYSVYCNWPLVILLHLIVTLEVVLCVVWHFEMVLRRVIHRLWSCCICPCRVNEGVLFCGEIDLMMCFRGMVVHVLVTCVYLLW